jgi:hypothetical protein
MSSSGQYHSFAGEVEASNTSTIRRPAHSSCKASVGRCCGMAGLMVISRLVICARDIRIHFLTAMLFTPTFRPKDYGEMLKTLAWFFFGLNIVVLYLLRSTIPTFDANLSYIDQFIGQIFPAGLKGAESISANVLIAGALAVLAHAIKLHDRVSDIFRIRHDFDIYKILVPLAFLSRSTVQDVGKLASRRGDLMQRVFYKYASSAKSSTVVDKHDITSALTVWMWFWALVEAAFQLVIAASVLFFANAFKLAFITLGVGFIAILLSRISYRAAATWAGREINQIIDDVDSCRAVRDVFNAL